ncbi:hypothetical protein H6F89_24980 [Cyanobacteria bacterium FACHB-63]|nr:hypothetical protein [Cyanobacteria bacterium FACHB-63]
MTRSFAVLVSSVCLFLGMCGFLITASDCYSSIRAGVISIFMSALAWGYLNMVNKKPVGVWLTLYRTGITVAGAIVVFAIWRIVGAMQATGCQVG